jgi:hypothetical protein
VEAIGWSVGGSAIAKALQTFQGSFLTSSRTSCDSEVVMHCRRQHDVLLSWFVSADVDSMKADVILV